MNQCWIQISAGQGPEECSLAVKLTLEKLTKEAKDLGCTIKELKIYLESKFQPGMTWENHGRFGWHIDHEVPLSSFDLTDREQFLKACHYTNLQPLWWNENLSKGKIMDCKF